MTASRAGSSRKTYEFLELGHASCVRHQPLTSLRSPSELADYFSCATIVAFSVSNTEITIWGRGRYAPNRSQATFSPEIHTDESAESRSVFKKLLVNNPGSNFLTRVHSYCFLLFLLSKFKNSIKGIIFQSRIMGCSSRNSNSFCSGPWRFRSWRTADRRNPTRCCRIARRSTQGVMYYCRLM